jgi:hypothetical protein
MYNLEGGCEKKTEREEGDPVCHLIAAHFSISSRHRYFHDNLMAGSIPVSIGNLRRLRILLVHSFSSCLFPRQAIFHCKSANRNYDYPSCKSTF